jgi:streptogramin lyase
MNPWRLTPIVVAVIAVGAGCGGDSSDDPDATASDASTATATATATASEPAPIPVAGAKKVSLDDRLLRQVTITDSPDWLVSAFDSLWVKRDNGVVDRVDPKRGKVVAEIETRPFKNPLCQGIGATDDAIWACPPGGGEIVRIDPDLEEVDATVKVDKLPDQGRLVSAAGHVWVLTDSGDELTGVDAETATVSTTLALPSSCVDLAASETTVWATCPLDGKVLRIDAEAGAIDGELELPGATNAAVAADFWVGFEGGVAQVDPESLEVIAVYGLYPRYGGSIFAADGAVWVREEDKHFLSRIDPSEQRVVETIAAPDLTSGGDVVVIGDAVWATAFDDQTLVALRASD